MHEVIKKIKNSLRDGILGDFIFKLMANTLSIAIRNILVLPILASIFSTKEYGELMTVIGVITTIAAGLGNSLLSTRLIMDGDYKRKNLQGDFNIFCIIVSVIGGLSCLAIHKIFPGVSTIQLIIISAVLFLETFVGYHSGWFILRQEFRKLLVYTIIGGIGFVIGLIFSNITKLWAITYLISDGFSIAFLLYFSPLPKENYSLTVECPKMLKKYFILIITTVISNALAYLDRLLLYPIIGSEAVAIYTTASVFGKAFNLIALPVSSIMLGYYAAEKIKLNLRRYWIINFSTLGVLMIFVVMTRFIGIWATGVLYPSIVNDAKPFILIANISSSIGASAQITKSAALKYAKVYWILLIQVIYAVVYLLGGYYGVLRYGLMGFSVAVLGANVIQIIILFIVCHIAVRNIEK